MSELKDAITEESVVKLRAALAAGEFPGVSFEHAMQFLLTDGMLPASGLPAASFLLLEDWARAQQAQLPSSSPES